MHDDDARDFADWLERRRLTPERRGLWAGIQFVSEYTTALDKQVWWRRWLKRPIPVAIGGKWCVVMENGAVMESRDGITWSKINEPIP